jgi:MATE family multidrug resistance protein
MSRAAPSSDRTGWRAEARATLALASPLVLTNFAQALISATDVLLLGRLGPEALAAGALGVNLVNAFMFSGVGLVTAAAPMIARELGRRRSSVRDVRRTVRQTMWSAIVLVALFWTALSFAGPIFRLLDQPPALVEQATSFVHAVMWGMLPYFLFLALRSFMAALERPGWSLAIGASAVIVNGLLNYGLIFGHFGLPALGVVGAGIGSSITNLLAFLALSAVVVLHPRFRRYRLFRRFWRADWPRFRDVWRLGLPIAVTLAMEVTVFNAAIFLMGLIGTAEIAAHAIAIQLATLSFMVPLGVAQAATVRVGLAFGRRDATAAGLAGWTAFVMATGFMCMTAILLVMIPRTLVGLFLDLANPANAHVAALAVSFLFVAAVFQIVDGAQVVSAGMLRGLHDTRVPMLFAMFGYWVVGIGIGVGLAFGAGLGGLGIWIGLASGLATVAVLMTLRWIRREPLGLLAR